MLNWNLGTWGFAISAVLAAIKVGEIVRSRLDRSADQVAKVNEAWLKAIVLEGAVPALREFIQLQRHQLKVATLAPAATVRPHAALLQNYLVESEALKNRLLPLRELSPNAYDTIERSVEKLDDAIAEYCPHADDRSYSEHRLAAEFGSVTRQFDDTFQEALRILRKVHFLLLSGKAPDAEIERPSAQ